MKLIIFLKKNIILQEDALPKSEIAETDEDTKMQDGNIFKNFQQDSNDEVEGEAMQVSAEARAAQPQSLLNDQED